MDFGEFEFQIDFSPAYVEITNIIPTERFTFDSFQINNNHITFVNPVITSGNGPILTLELFNNVGVDALSGNTAISGAANTVLTIHHLQDPETNKLQKNIKERRIVREARSGEDFDLIATLNFDNSFKVVCNFEDYQEKQTLEEQEKKIINRFGISQSRIAAFSADLLKRLNVK